MAAKKTSRSKKTGQKGKARDVGMIAQSVPVAPDRKMPWFGWLGLAIMIASEIALYLEFHPTAVVFTPIMWTGYILFIDGWIWARGGISYFLDRQEKWPMLALISVLIWVMFEAFNFKVQAWQYFNRPEPFARDVIFAWAFATIIPALLRTRTLFSSFKFFDRAHPWKIRFTPFLLGLSFVIGIAFTFLPVMFDDYLANLFIPFVWVGLIFLLEPINYRIGAPSIYRDLEDGRISFFWQILAAGLLCGLLWESWNKQAIPFDGLIWKYYLNPIYHTLSFNLQIGEMPLLGFLGYPPFIWECYALWELVRWAMHGDTLWKPPGAVKA